jgi:error-prone DNA polymerase
MGFKRSVEKMQAIETRLRTGMAERGITGKVQDQIVLSITSFALYGFPESHAASFALIAYASAWLRCYHPTAFYVALLNAWPMGFYHPATLIKDAQRHGVEARPVDVNYSRWRCTWEEQREIRASSTPPVSNLPPGQVRMEGSQRTERTPDQGAVHTSLPRKGGRVEIGGVEEDPISPPRARSAQAEHAAGALRIGLRYVRGLRQSSGEAIERARAVGAFVSAEDLQRRCGLRADELTTLAEAGALASLGLSRRAALWQEAQVSRPSGPLFAGRGSGAVRAARSPLPEMTQIEEIAADYSTTEITTGAHPVSYVRGALARYGIVAARDLGRLPAGKRVRTAGSVIVRQRPGTAKGMLFLTLEDETGMSQAIVTPDLMRENRQTIVGSPGLVVEGILQHRDGSISVRAEKFWPLAKVVAAPSHDFR